MWMVFRRIPGPSAAERWRRAARLAAPLLAAALVAACNYTFRGGGGLPESIRTIYIAPFENETAQLDLDVQLFTQVTQEIPPALGLRVAGEQVADAVLRGRILRYDDVAQNYRPDAGAGAGVNVLQREVTVAVAIEIIDVQRNLILWEGSSVSGKGTYRPDEGQTEEQARLEAIQVLVQQIRDGAQSQW